MNFQQLRIIRETVRCNFNLTEVAGVLYTSQSGVSKHIKDLEDELGVELFIRRGKRLLGLTEPGKELTAIVERMLLDADNIKRLAEHFAEASQGAFTIATTHTQARYALPPVVAQFKKHYPSVRLIIHQGSPTEIAAMLLDGRADIAIATEALSESPDIVAYPYYSWHHGCVVPIGHELTQQTPLTLEAIAKWPIITYHEGFTGRSHIDERFARAGIAPDIVMAALDADVIKAYVELGMGIGLMAAPAFDAARDTKLRLLDVSHLFEQQLTRIAVRRGRYLRGFAYRFIELCSPGLTESIVRVDLG